LTEASAVGCHSIDSGFFLPPDLRPPGPRNGTRMEPRHITTAAHLIADDARRLHQFRDGGGCGHLHQSAAVSLACLCRLRCFQHSHDGN
jgi:hypothetical protein